MDEPGVESFKWSRVVFAAPHEEMVRQEWVCVAACQRDAKKATVPVLPVCQAPLHQGTPRRHSKSHSNEIQSQRLTRTPHVTHRAPPRLPKTSLENQAQATLRTSRIQARPPSTPPPPTPQRLLNNRSPTERQEKPTLHTKSHYPFTPIIETPRNTGLLRTRARNSNAASRRMPHSRTPGNGEHLERQMGANQRADEHGRCVTHTSVRPRCAENEQWRASPSAFAESKSGRFAGVSGRRAVRVWKSEALRGSARCTEGLLASRSASKLEATETIRQIIAPREGKIELQSRGPRTGKCKEGTKKHVTSATEPDQSTRYARLPHPRRTKPNLQCSSHSKPPSRRRSNRAIPGSPKRPSPPSTSNREDCNQGMKREFLQDEDGSRWPTPY